MGAKQKLPAWFRRTLSTLRQFRRSGLLTDLTLRCAGGEAVAAHAALLAAGSSLVRRLCGDVAAAGDDGALSLDLPDFGKEQVEAFVALFYLSSPPQGPDQADTEDLCRVFQVAGWAEDHKTANQSNPFEGSRLVRTLEDDTEEDEEEEGDDPAAAGEELKILQTEEGEILLVDLDNNPGGGDPGEAEHQARVTAALLASKQECPVCGRRVEEHRAFVKEDDDEEAENRSPPSYAAFVYRCCLPSCPYSRDSFLATAKSLVRHLAGHGPGAAAAAAGELAAAAGGATGARRCPICRETRKQHRNTEIGSTKRGSLYKCCQCSAAKLPAAKFFPHVEGHVTKRFGCPDCDRAYTYRHLLDAHRQKEHGVAAGEDKTEEHKVSSMLPNRALEVPPESSEPKIASALSAKALEAIPRPSASNSGSSATRRCAVCLQGGFASAATLANHVRARHTDERPYRCEYCPAAYATAMTLSGHRARRHSVNRAGEFVPRPKFPCEACGKLLTSRTKLDRHRRVVHQGLRDFACPFCDRRFSSRSNLRSHEASLHTGDHAHRCPDCGRGFSRRDALARHLGRDHAKGADAGAVMGAALGLAAAAAAAGEGEAAEELSEGPPAAKRAKVDGIGVTDVMLLQ